MTSLRNYVITILAFISLSTYAQTSGMELCYRELSARFESRDKGLLRDLKAYLQSYPYTTYADEVQFMQGVLQVEKAHYKQALKILEQVEPKALSRAHQTDYSFYRGYAYLMMKDYARAAIYFGHLRKSDTRYTTRGNYYYAYCMYKQERYEDALPALLTLEEAGVYEKTVPYYIVQIYYAQGNKEEVVSRAEELLRRYPDAPNNAALHRMLGEIAYGRQDYGEAVRHLRAYRDGAKAQQEELERVDIYLLGVSEYALGEYEASVASLKQVKSVRDTISENACLTMGNAYVQLQQPEQAKLSYQAAAGYQLTPAITEEAAYNYALCAYQSSSALGEAVHAFRDFLEHYPHSTYESRVYALLSDALMQSKNYAAAIETLDAVASPTPKMLETKQYLRYQLGADLFLQGKMQQSADWMTEVIRHAAESDRYTTEALFMRAEACYRLRQYAACDKDLVSFFARPDAKQSSNYLSALYLNGYCAFAQGHYERAHDAFVAYIDAAPMNEPSYADALNRLGDCAFNARHFADAIAYYGQVSALQSTGADYALFQKGYALGLQHKYEEKISVLRELVKRYPKSDYADDGMYEIARAQLQREDERGAIGTYEELLSHYPHSSLARKASLERAMLFRNLHENEQAIAAYRATIADYPATEEAYTALEALQALYVEAGKVDEYMEYTKQLAKLNMTVTTQGDSLLYASAEMQYMQGEYTKAIGSLNQYLKQYCSGGRWCTTARFYLADAYYRLGQTTEALEHYKILAEADAHPFREEAATRVAELCYDKGDYTCALAAFYRMHGMASTHERLTVARLGILRCSEQLGRPQVTIDIATQLLNDSPVSDETRMEALYGRAKAYLAQGERSKAEPDLQTLSAEVRTSLGAEAKYLLAENAFVAGDLDKAEAEVMAFTRMDTQQQYWLARALILLSDINRERGELFQARQYLLVLKQNYTLTGDDIHTIIAERIERLNQLEQPVQTEEPEEEEGL